MLAALRILSAEFMSVVGRDEVGMKFSEWPLNVPRQLIESACTKSESKRLQHDGLGVGGGIVRWVERRRFIVMAIPRRWMALVAPAVVLMVVISMSAPLARGQGAEDAPHPAHIHSGTCDNLGDIVAPLSDVTELTAGEVFGARTAVLVKESETDVEMPLGDILAAPHAINIHESADAIQNYIACGDIGGRVIDGNLSIGLRELNGSGHHGVAVLEGADDGTGVKVYLTEEGAGAETEQEAAPAVAATATVVPVAATTAPATAAPAETPGDTAPDEEAPAAAEVAVDIRNFAYSPNPVEIAVGDTVTWTNQDEVPHTATGDDRGVLQSGTIAPGASFRQVFPEAGEFAYHCEFHPNMSGTVVVQ
jgi:plastocyanin